MSVSPLRLGFIALNDAASLIVAQAHGLFAAEGLDVTLSREVSWATVRDKVTVGALDGSHMLAPTALAITLGLTGQQPTPLVAPFALNLNGPAITLSSRLAEVVGPGGTAEGLARLVARRRAEGASPLTFAVVFPFSTHNYLLRDWLARAGIDPDKDVRLTIAPPARMTELLAGGVVEGFCVTEPWNTAAVVAGVGAIVARGAELWPRTPDKVFAVTDAWARQNPDTLQGLLRALIRAAAWADAPDHRRELASLLAQSDYVGASAEVIETSLAGMVFDAEGANAPAPLHAAWLAGQMQRWGHIDAHQDLTALAAQVYRPDLHAQARAALGLTPISLPSALNGFARQ